MNGPKKHFSKFNLFLILSLLIFFALLMVSVFMSSKIYQEKHVLKSRLNKLERKMATQNPNFQNNKQWKVFLNEGSLGFSFQYPSTLYFDLNFLERAWVIKENGDLLLYGCFSEKLPPDMHNRGTEPAWCIGSVSVERKSIDKIMDDYTKLSEELIGVEEMDGGEITEADIKFSDVVITDAKINAKRIIMVIKKKGVIPDVPKEWDEVSIDYVIPYEDLVYIFSNAGFGGTIVESVFNEIVGSAQFLR